MKTNLFRIMVLIMMIICSGNMNAQQSEQSKNRYLAICNEVQNLLLQDKPVDISYINKLLKNTNWKVTGPDTIQEVPWHDTTGCIPRLFICVTSKKYDVVFDLNSDLIKMKIRAVYPVIECDYTKVDGCLVGPYSYEQSIKILEEFKKVIEKKMLPKQKKNTSTTEDLSKLTIADKTVLVVNDAVVTLELWDYANLDGDIVDVYVDGFLIISNLHLTNQKFIVPISVNQASEVTIKAISVGKLPPCTVRANIVELKQEFTLEAKKDEVMKIVLKHK